MKFRIKKKENKYFPQVRCGLFWQTLCYWYDRKTFTVIKGIYFPGCTKEYAEQIIEDAKKLPRIPGKKEGRVLMKEIPNELSISNYGKRTEEILFSALSGKPEGSTERIGTKNIPQFQRIHNSSTCRSCKKAK